MRSTYYVSIEDLFFENVVHYTCLQNNFLFNPFVERYDILCGPRGEDDVTGVLGEMGYSSEQVYKFQETSSYIGQTFAKNRSQAHIFSTVENEL